MSPSDINDPITADTKHRSEVMGAPLRPRQATIRAGRAREELTWVVLEEFIQVASGLKWCIHLTHVDVVFQRPTTCAPWPIKTCLLHPWWWIMIIVETRILIWGLMVVWRLPRPPEWPYWGDKSYHDNTLTLANYQYGSVLYSSSVVSVEHM